MAAPLSDEGLDIGATSGFGDAGFDASFSANTSYGSNALSTIFERMPRPSFEEFTTIA
jgi:3-hydroxypropanoate dehydrogenase